MLTVIAFESRVAALPARIAIACGLVIVGSILAADFKGISSSFLKDSSGFSPWGKKREQWRGPNPVRLVGLFFLVFGRITLFQWPNFKSLPFHEPNGARQARLGKEIPPAATTAINRQPTLNAST